MFCTTCGRQTPDASTFCLHCGNRINAPSLSYQSSPVITPPVKKSNSGLKMLGILILLGGVGVVLILALIVGGIVYKSSQSRSSYNPSSPSQVLTNRHSIVNSTFHVGARQYVYYTFTVPSSGHVIGNFRASGGSNDIEVVIFDADGFENFRNGHRASRVYYKSSGYVTTDTIDKNIPAGTYYIVFNNGDALLTNKTVAASVDVEY